MFMKQTLVLGSTCLDVMLKVPQFPASGDDINLESTHRSLGGCAYNVSDILTKFQIPHTLCSPIGEGFYSSLVEQMLLDKGSRPFAQVHDMDNGACYCIVDAAGHQTFLAKHGAEYRFNAGWFSSIDWDNVDSIYCCGLEIEDIDGEDVVSFLEEKKELFDSAGRDLTIFFAPGARIMHIPQLLIQRIFALHPILHLNDREARLFTGTESIEECARILHSTTCNSLVITMAAKGAYCFDHQARKGFPVPSKKVEAVDSTGAGDAHCGAVIANLKLGLGLVDSVLRANRLSALLVTVPGANLPDSMFSALHP